MLDIAEEARRSALHFAFRFRRRLPNAIIQLMNYSAQNNFHLTVSDRCCSSIFMGHVAARKMGSNSGKAEKRRIHWEAGFALDSFRSCFTSRNRQPFFSRNFLFIDRNSPFQINRVRLINSNARTADASRRSGCVIKRTIAATAPTKTPACAVSSAFDISSFS